MGQRSRRCTATGTILAGIAAALVLAATPAGAAPTSDVESRLLGLINVERSNAGLGEVVRNVGLDAIARDWSQVLGDMGEPRHNPSLRDQLCCWLRYGENVGWRQVPTGDLTAGTDWIHRELMASAVHREHILHPDFDEVGIGAVVVNGTLWVTQVFRHFDEPPPEPVPAPVVEPAPRPSPALTDAPTVPAPTEPLVEAGRPPEQRAIVHLAMGTLDGEAAARHPSVAPALERRPGRSSAWRKAGSPVLPLPWDNRALLAVPALALLATRALVRARG